MTDSAVELSNIVKRFDSFTAVQRFSMSLESGSFVTLLGPSGCGKTTTLRMVAGLLDPSEGDIRIRGRRVNEVPIHQRNLGLVFQNYALFPHRNVFDNVAFGLKYRKVSKADIRQRVKHALELVQLPDLGRRMPSELSGGQQQRVALARAIVIEPDVLLLDEPLSALDANLREDMRIELKRIQTQLGITTLFVTHDQSEALAMSDKIVVMRDGVVEQIGAPREVYDKPVSEFVAGFLGAANILDARVQELDSDNVLLEVDDLGMIPVPRARCPACAPGTAMRLVLRSEHLIVQSADERRSHDGLYLSARIATVDYQGQAVRYFLHCGKHTLQALNMLDGPAFNEGDSVSLKVRHRDAVVLETPP